jgi:WD40 repeat protein
VAALVFSHKGEFLASADTGGAVQLWSLEGKSLASSELSAGIKSLAFSPDGQLLAAGASDGSVRLLRVRDLQEVSRTRAHKNTVYGVAFNPTGSLLASAGFDREIHIWEIRDK